MVTPVKSTLETKLLARELSNPAVRAHSHRTLYSDRRLVSNLDIVNELQGHSGCVNALSWSKSGRLLASGSDDQHINIHTYQSEASDEQFRLSATVATGHTQNIFSVKFMPHSDDRTVVSAAGDGEVRVFDLEYSGASVTASNASSRASQRRRGRSDVYATTRYLTDGDTNSRVYRSHGDRVKRIVTESSPHLFLTCSEDGEVRQWDLRQPSSAYPDPRDSDVPPPLISYKRYHLDLNSISCSASQPHYIALGGAHLHAFLHDRRMSGRDLQRERGSKLSPKTEGEEEAMASATRCVRKFAPKGQQKMKRTQSGHITALKISDARPDEMIASWSGDSIYCFDLIRDAEVEEAQASQGAKSSPRNRVRPADASRKRKRKVGGASSGSLGEDATSRAASVPRTESPSTSTNSDAALRIRYANGQSEDVPLTSQAFLTNAQQRARQIAQHTAHLRRTLYSTSTFDSQTNFDTFLKRCQAMLDGMDTTMRLWRYPIAPSSETIRHQQALRAGRCSARRFVQATGTLCRTLGGSLATSTELDLQPFARVQNKANDIPLPRNERFAYDFVAAICLWLDSGIGRLIEGFTKLHKDTPAAAELHARIIDPDEAGPEAVEEVLIPYLMALAGQRAVKDPTANQFLSEEAEEGSLFGSEKQAVRAFGEAVGRGFQDLSSGAEGTGNVGSGEGMLDRKEAVGYWGEKVARAVLLGVGKELDQAVIEAAFGGQPREQGDVEQAVHSITIRDATGEEEEFDTDALTDATDALAAGEAMDSDSDSSELPADFFDTSTEDEDGADPEEQEDDDDSSDPDDEEDGVPTSSLQRFLYRSAFERNRHKSRVHPHIPCSGPLRSYSGHLNVRTVKDVAYFGLNDEYVVSGSDDGNVFIWDAASTELVNILEGDGEVVNVVQGHPYESMMAVSGIDHSVKIFSPDGRAREDARLGRRGVSSADSGEFSSLAWPHRARMRRTAPRAADAGDVTSEPAVPRSDHDNDTNDRNDDNNDYDDSLVAPNGLRSRKKMHEQYKILASNNSARDRGDDDDDEGGFGGGRAFLSIRDVQPLLMLLGGRLDLD